MPKKTKKKRIFLWAMSIIPILLIIVIAVPIAILYVQYQSISYVPSVPVERPDIYVLPEYPEVVEYETEIETETEPSEPPTESSVPETLPSVIYISTETDAPSEVKPAVSEKSSNQANTTTKYNHNNSFANTAKTINVYGRTPIYKVARKFDNIINILVLGTDSRDVALERGRSDTMIVVSYNQKTGEIKMVSMLRDMLVPIEGYDWNRINAAYSFDGVGLSINTVNQLFGLDIQHFVVVDLNGAKDFINYIGGIELSLSESEAKYVGVPYSAEPMLLDGSAALNHMRNRTSDNDFGRTERQREVIVAVFNKILSEKSLTKILDITKYATGMVKTNISATTLTALVTSIVSKADNLSIESQSLPYTDAYKSAWYKKKAILSFDIQSTAKRMLEFLYE